jgi:hypothetical protein
MSRKPVAAIMYDFDKTLSTKDMQEFNFIPNVGSTSTEFWSEVKELSMNEKMDNNLAYMYLMIDKSNGMKKSVHRQDFVNLGKNVEYFPGVEDWFKRINEYGKSKQVTIEHYIISSGIAEIIEGTSIRKYFKEVYACEFYYDQNDVAVWPKNVVNFTTKTQYVYRINKGALDPSDNDTINKYVPDEERPIPFRNMIYIGDGLTDVPGMKVVKANGGHSIAVYSSNKKTARELIRDGRVNLLSKADYSENSDLDVKVKAIIDQISASHALFLKESADRKKVQKELKQKSDHSNEKSSCK